MKTKKQIVVTDWTKNKPKKGSFLKLTLSSEQRRILRGKRITDCSREIILQLPRIGKLKDGDVLKTDHSELYINIIAKKENLLEVSSKSKLELIKTAYHLGNRHVAVEICRDVILIRNDYLIEEMLKIFNVEVLNTQKKFFPELGAHDHK